MNYGYAGTRELNEALVSLNTIVGLAQTVSRLIQGRLTAGDRL